MGFGGTPSWMTALEMQFAALREWRKVKPTVPSHPSHDLMMRHIPHALATAMPYAWTTETASAVVMASKTIPDDTKLAWASLPKTFEAPMWWWFDKPLPWASEPHKDDPYPLFVRVLLIWIGTNGGHPLTTEDLQTDGIDDESPCLRVLVLGSATDEHELEMICVFAWDLEQTLRQNVEDFDAYRKPEQAPLTDADHVFSLQLMRFIAAAFVWLNQRIVQYSAGHIERHRRKQLAREHDGPVPAEVKVIQLRRADSADSVTTAGPLDVEWSCRWIVSGHWRNQAYANGEHKLIYILPYVKGPDDKPLKVPSHTVYSVSR